MSRWTIDASVAVKWFVPEVHSEAAASWLGADFELLAPDLLYPEVGNILWKKFRRSELSAREMQIVRKAIDRVPFQLSSGRKLLGAAIDLAMGLDRSAYDCMYLAVAMAFDAPLVTADRKLFEAIGATRFAGHVRWLEDKP